MAITSQLVGTIGGGAETIIIPPTGKSDQNVTATNTSSGSSTRITIDGQELRFPGDSTTTVSVVLAGGRTITIPAPSFSITYLTSFAVKIKP